MFFYNISKDICRKCKK